MVGATLGGGVGPYGGLHGLQIDALQSVTMVTGTGSLINVSATSHPDLWWGMRGAGFNFGIVTSATYQVYDYTNKGQAMNADFRFHASQNASLYEFARSFTGKLPDAFSIDIAIAYNEAFGGVSRPLQTIYGLKEPTNIPLDLSLCQFHLCRSIRRGNGAHPVHHRHWPLSKEHHDDTLERHRDSVEIWH